MMSITRSRFRKVIRKPSRTSSRWSIFSTRCSDRRFRTSRRWSRKARSTSFKRTDLGHLAVDQHVHVQTEPAFQFGVAKQRRHQHLGLDGARPWFEDDADILGAFVAHIGQQRHLLELDQFGQLFDQLGFLHLIGDLGDHDLPGAPAQILDLPFRPQCGTTRARCDRPAGSRRAVRRSRRRSENPGPG